jgi:hypothetical protein
LDLPAETTLAAARAEVSFSVLTPERLGPPDQIFLLELGEPSTAQVWTDPAAIDEVLHVLFAIPSTEIANKISPQTYQAVEVSEAPAIWATGEHVFEVFTRDGPMRLFVRGNVLIWKLDQVTYRLETVSPLDEAILIAESLR